MNSRIKIRIINSNQKHILEKLYYEKINLYDIKFNNKNIEIIIDEIFDEVKPESMKDMGKVMGPAQAKLKGKADMKEVSSIIREKLQ